MWPFKKKSEPKVAPPETELRRNLREASTKLHDKMVSEYVETLLKECREASEKGLFSISSPEKPSGNDFVDWAVDGHRIIRQKGLDVKYSGGIRSPVIISWK